jgi:CO/xanthine dehydrogenase Mo-binding subunit
VPSRGKFRSNATPAKVRIGRVTAAVDTGEVVNPNGVRK